MIEQYVYLLKVLVVIDIVSIMVLIYFQQYKK